jgi:hypothetical protein
MGRKRQNKPPTASDKRRIAAAKILSQMKKFLKMGKDELLMSCNRKFCKQAAYIAKQVANRADFWWHSRAEQTTNVKDSENRIERKGGSGAEVKIKEEELIVHNVYEITEQGEML